MAKETIIKSKLKEAGLSYRQAAPQLGVTYQYLCDVCNGVHTSRRLSAKILAICNRRIDSGAPRRANRRAM
jgi:DNA-binding helix-turn-helix protein